MDLSSLMTALGQQFGIQPSTMVFYLFLLNRAADIIARLIPDNSTGWLAVVRKVAAVIGTHVSSRIAPGVSVNDVATATLTPAVEKKVAANAAEDAK